MIGCHLDQSANDYMIYSNTRSLDRPSLVTRMEPRADQRVDTVTTVEVRSGTSFYPAPHYRNHLTKFHWTIKFLGTFDWRSSRCLREREAQSKSKRTGALVRLNQWGFHLPLPAMHLVNIRSLPNKIDELLLQKRCCLLCCPLHHWNLDQQTQFWQWTTSTGVQLTPHKCQKELLERRKVVEFASTNTQVLSKHCSPNMKITFSELQSLLLTAGVPFIHDSHCLHSTPRRDSDALQAWNTKTKQKQHVFNLSNSIFLDLC